MAKEKSLKLRTILALCALYKHSDKDHRLTPRKLNTFLKPYDLKISGVGLSDDIKILRQFGLDAYTNEGTQTHSAYIGDHLFSDETLKKLVFAVSTNPYMGQNQATEILQQLKPLVTVYQEPLLQSFHLHTDRDEKDDSLYWNYLVMKEAIAENRRVLYAIDYVKYNGSTKGIDHMREWETLFTPVSIYKENGKLYALGYNNTDNEVENLDLSRLATVRLAPEYKLKKEKIALQKASIYPEEHAVPAGSALLYEGPAVFRCFVSNIGALYDLFGAPTGPVEQAYNFRTTYPVERTNLTAETLTQLTELSADGGLRIVGPEALLAAARDRFDTQADILLSKRFPRKSGVK